MPLFNKFFWVTSVNHFQDFILITFSYWDGNCAKSLFNFPISEALRFLCLFCQSKLRKKVVSQSSRTFYLFPWDSQTWTWNFLHWLVITIRHADDTYSISWNEVTSIGHDASRKKNNFNGKSWKYLLRVTHGHFVPNLCRQVHFRRQGS